MDEVNVEDAYKRYFPIVSEKCRRMLRDASLAQDVAQETFERLWAKRRLIQNPAGVASWIYATSTRIAIDRMRRQRAWPEAALGLDDLCAATSSPEQRASERQLLERVLAEVPARELEVVILSRIDGLTHDAIARVTGRSDRSVRRLLSRFEGRQRRLAGEAA